MKKNFIFDLDGTLVDSLPGIAAAMCAALPQTNSGILRSHIGPSVRFMLRSLANLQGSPLPEIEVDRLESAFRRHYDSEGWRSTAAFPGAGELLQQLHSANRRMFLVTNKPWTPVANILQMLGLDSYFEHILTSDSISPSFQNKTEMLRFLVDRRSLKICDCLMVGDTTDDFTAARALGIDAICVAHGYGGEKLSSEFPDCEIVTDLSAIGDRYGQITTQEYVTA